MRRLKTSTSTCYLKNFTFRGAKLDKCLNNKEALEQKFKNLENSATQSRAKLIQLQSTDNDVRDSLTKTEDELASAKKKIATLESSLTFKTTELVSSEQRLNLEINSIFRSP